MADLGPPRDHHPAGRTPRLTPVSRTQKLTPVRRKQRLT
jgi:hypothetical protein